MKMTTEEAFVKVLQMHGIAHAFGIIGSAFMPISDFFSKAASPSICHHFKAVKPARPSFVFELNVMVSSIFTRHQPPRSEA
jgi:glyoxylate carboligase